ncbi:MAG TPA: DUF488 domain-containing protein [Terriglobales bacterium]
MERRVYTIGHSNHEFAKLLALLQQHGVTAVGDVRSAPYSKRYPQFSREPLEKALREAGITYVYLGKELGARSDDPSCYEKGSVKYERLAKTAPFQSGLDRVERGLEQFTLALLCAEKEPLHCHRTLLVARNVEARGIRVEHILEDGSVEPHTATVSRLLRLLHEPETDLFRSHEQIVNEAYEKWGDKIAYVREETEAE